MAVNLVLRTIGALLAIGLATYVTTYIMYQLKATILTTMSFPPEALAIINNTYTVFQWLPLLMLGTVILWSFMAATRRQGEIGSYDG